LDDRLEKIEEGEEDVRKAAGKNSLPLSSRMDLVERDVRGHARSIGVLTHVLGEHSRSLNDVEEWRVKSLMEEVRREEQSKALVLKLDRMSSDFHEGLKSVQAEVNSMRGTWTRILWTVGSPVAIAAVVALLTLTFGKGVPPIT
jgi:hypothetical protein